MRLGATVFSSVWSSLKPPVKLPIFALIDIASALREEEMRTFSLFTTDTRYSVPTLTLVLAEDDARATVLARNNLAESQFHIAVEVREGDRQVCQLRRQEARPGPPPDESVAPIDIAPASPVIPEGKAWQSSPT